MPDATDDSGIRAHVAREAVTMLVYLAIVLLALLASIGDEEDATRQVALIWGTAIGLGIAHLFAFRPTAIVASGGRPSEQDLRIGLGVAVAAFLAATVATVPYLFISDPVNASTGADLVLLALIGAAGYGGARKADLSVPRSLLYTGIVLSAAAVVVAIKLALAH